MSQAMIESSKFWQAIVNRAIKRFQAAGRIIEDEWKDFITPDNRLGQASLAAAREGGLVRLVESEDDLCRTLYHVLRLCIEDSMRESIRDHMSCPRCGK